jgi:hypothetical protein
MDEQRLMRAAQRRQRALRRLQQCAEPESAYWFKEARAAQEEMDRALEAYYEVDVRQRGGALCEYEKEVGEGT